MIYGSPGRGTGSFDLADIRQTGAGEANENGQLGFVIDGATSADRVGDQVSSAGDINGDGFDDLLLGARSAGAGGEGESYIVFGGNFTGAVSHSGTSGNDTLSGNGGDNNMLGGTGDDILDGADGNDRLVGGTGDDLLTGGAGNDLFVFSDYSGSDTIEDFELSTEPDQVIDQIDLTDVSGVGGFVDLAIQAVGNDTEIDLGGGNTITLLGVNPADLGTEDFLF